MLQNIIIIILIAAAVFFLVKCFLKSVRGGCEFCGKKCADCKKGSE